MNKLGWKLKMFWWRLEGKLRRLWWELGQTSFINHISFLWHWKNFFFCLKYPFWRVRNVWSGKFMGYSYTWYDYISIGWQKAFGKQLSEDIKKAGKESRRKAGKYISWKKMLHWEQIKDKYGGLRLYASSTEEIDKVLDKYEVLSFGYCMHDGNPVRYVPKNDWWVQYLCEECMDNYLEQTTLTKMQKRKLKKQSRLKKADIPTSQYHDIDFYKLWNIPRKNTKKLVEIIEEKNN